MWWTVFTAVDLYLGLIILDAIAPSVPNEKKLTRLRIARKIVLALLVASAVVLLIQIARRYGH